MEQILTLLNDTNTIPHILFYGEQNSGKRELLNFLLNHIYTPEEKKQYCMFIECATCKGIKFIRDDIKEFAKQQINNQLDFKSIILYDAENLTNDAQYSLRRCIEIYSKTTRFFIVTSNKDKLINPICSRFVQLYIPKKESEPTKYKWSSAMKEWLKEPNLFDLAEKLYVRGIYGDMLLEYFRNDSLHFIEFEFEYEKMCRELKNETWILYYILEHFIKNNSLYK